MNNIDLHPRGSYLPMLPITVSLIIIIFSPAAALSQDITEVYRDYLPQAILDNDQYREMVSKRLDAKAMIHPELLYFHLRQLQNLFQDTNKISPSILNEYILEKEHRYIANRSSWAHETLRRIKESSPGLSVEDAAAAYLNPIMNNSSRAPTAQENLLTINQTQMDYLVWLYYRRDTTMRFDPDEDYRGQRLEIERSKLAQYENQYDAIGLTTSIQSEGLITDLIREWYIFDDVTAGSSDAGSSHHAGDIIGALLRHNYMMDHKSGFSVEVGYCIYNTMSIITNTLPARYTYYPSYRAQPTNLSSPEVEHRFPVKQFIVSLGYRFSLRDEIGILSYLNVRTAASRSTGHAAINESTHLVNTQSSPDVDITVDETLEQQSIVNSFNTYVARVGIPFLVIGRSIFCEVTVNGGLLSVNTSTGYDYSMRKTEGYYAGPFGGVYYYSHTIAIGRGAGTSNVRNNSFLFYPTLDLTFDSDMGIQLSVSGNNRYLSILCGYQL